MRKKYQKAIITLSKKKPGLYTAAYIISAAFMLLVLAFIDFPVKSVFCPLFFSGEESGGMIESVVTEREEAAIKAKKLPVYGYYFVVDDLMIEVTPGDMREYEEGDWFPYYRYEAGEKVIGVRRAYNPWVGGVSMILSAAAILNGFLFMLTETNEEKLAKRRKQQGIPAAVQILLILLVMLPMAFFLRSLVMLLL